MVKRKIKDTDEERDPKANHTWRYTAKERDDTPHPGSYASEGMRTLFNVEFSDPPQEEEKRQKRKLAIFIAYLGTAYGGLQINEGQRSIQAEIELAMYRASLITKSNFGFPYKVGFSVSGRTDKGVHACAQVVSLKVETKENQTLDEIREAINEFLPEDIRVLDVSRVTRKFCAHTDRERVRYQYLIPSFLFYDREKLKDLFEGIDSTKKDPETDDALSIDERQKIRKSIKDYRVTTDQLNKLKEALQKYEGTNSFHNYTRGVKPDEGRAMRFIESFTVEEPMEFDDGTQWIPTQVHGQSFMIHQIRKMISMAVDVARGSVPVEGLTRAMLPSTTDMTISKAPAQGLFLEMSFYNGYNKRKKERHDKKTEELPDIDWDKVDSKAHERWKSFRDDTIMAHIVEEEEKEMNFVLYLFYQERLFNREEFYQLDKLASSS